MAQGGMVTNRAPPRHPNFVIPPLRNAAAAAAAAVVPVPAPLPPPPAAAPPAAVPFPPQPPAVPLPPAVVTPIAAPAPAPPQLQPAYQVAQPARPPVQPVQPRGQPSPIFAQPAAPFVQHPLAQGYAAPNYQSNPPPMLPPVVPGQPLNRAYAYPLVGAQGLLQALPVPGLVRSLSGRDAANAPGLRPAGLSPAPPLPGPARPDYGGRVPFPPAPSPLGLTGPAYGAALPPAPPVPPEPAQRGPYTPWTAAARDPANHPWNWKDPGEMHFHDHNRKPIPFPTDAEDHDSVVEDADRHLWTRAANLGSGAFGSVQLWIKYDRDTGNVLDRVAVKSVTCTEKFWLHDAALWFDGVASRRVPAEAAAMRVLNNELHNLSNEELNDTTNEGVRVELNNELEDDPSEELKENSLCPLIIGYRGCRVYADEKRTFRIAMPASEFGSFYSWIEDKVKSLPRGGQLPDLPPAFIFDFFAACLTAVRFMVKRNMVHNDIKLDNLLIFADDPILESPLSEFEHDEGSGLGWGFHPVFTDFGLTTPIHCRAIPNPQGLVGMGTTSYQPPEQVVDRGRPSLPGKPRHSIVHGQENEPVNEKAMVFSIAVMVFRLLHPLECTIQPLFVPHPLVPGGPRPAFRNLYSTFGDNPGTHTNGRVVDDRTKIDHHFNTRANLVALPNGNRNDSYRPLREILTGCLRFNPKQRPSIDETLVMIKQHRSKDPQNPEFVEDFRKAAWMEFYDPLGKKVNPVDLRDTRDYVSMKNIPENEDESEESEAS